jgi:hypothetical protein
MEMIAGGTMTSPRQAPPAPAQHVFDAGGTDPDFYFPQSHAGARDGGFLRLVRALGGRLVRTLRG